MKFKVNKSSLSGTIPIPGSKSHTIRALAFALLARGESLIERPLFSTDTESCLSMIQQLGAKVKKEGDNWRVTGTGGKILVPDDVIDVGNSGTSLYIGIGLAALADGSTVFTGDHQIRSRPSQNLLLAINHLGGNAFSTRKNGKPPVVVSGPIAGGGTTLEAVTSQYLSSLLIALPCAPRDSVIDVTKLNEQPYVDMTMAWMEKLGVYCENRDYRQFLIKGGQRYRSFSEAIPADFSAAVFFMSAAAITGSELVLEGLDYNDSQGDREVANILKKMGADVKVDKRRTVIKGKKLTGGVFDLNDIPDSLPSLAVAACFAEGETRLVNVPQARLKETDRISVMCAELSKLGADIQELPDGLVIKGKSSGLSGGRVNGHYDHRVVMALAVGGLACEGGLEVDTAEASAITFPDFFDLMKTAGADITKEE
ncbi:MAG: 3-phosphoshikimate 1-carboxyvinyltransferase [Spirochaetia bacterium]|jgi:3-phosphoshikimate 1-carboxyvinyltransferase|nr:3-phosphoshikimate 1-carboxyvinyltransferase [Spirochaetia bacterium]